MKGMLGSSKRTYFVTLKQLRYAFKHKPHWNRELENPNSPLVELLTHPQMAAEETGKFED